MTHVARAAALLRTASRRSASLEWVTLDLTIVRGLAYYTGIVFELFDAKGEFRAICGGGRYDTCSQSLGGVDLPALGFGMGDVVLGELLRDRGLMPPASTAPDVWVAAEARRQPDDVRRAATALRARGVSVEYALREQPLDEAAQGGQSGGRDVGRSRCTTRSRPSRRRNRVAAESRTQAARTLHRCRPR